MTAAPGSMEELLVRLREAGGSGLVAVLAYGSLTILSC